MPKLYILLIFICCTKIVLAQSKDTIALSKQEYYIKKGLNLSESQAFSFFNLDRKRTLVIDSIYKHTKNTNNDNGYERSSLIKKANGFYISKMKAILNKNQLTIYEQLEEAKRKQYDHK
ncbi:MAG: hypothetical protein PW786_03505 [Arachidicoccus sp.]|nr:hypothetical protein [Arachidicoccus sp.]